MINFLFTALSFLNAGLRREDTSSLGRIPKKKPSTPNEDLKSAKTDEKDGKSEKDKERKSMGKVDKEDKTTTGTSKDDINKKTKHHKDDKKKSHKKDQDCDANDNTCPSAVNPDESHDREGGNNCGHSLGRRKKHQSNDSNTELPPGRGYDFDDDILPGMDETGQEMNKFLLDDGKSLESSRTYPDKDSLFSNVMQTQPTAGTIPGLGEVKDEPRQQDESQVKDRGASDLTKRQVLKSGAGFKCVLSGYNPVRKCDPKKVDFMQSFSAALHGYVSLE